MRQDFEVLSNHLETLLQTSLGTKHLINPFFRISKSTPEQTKKYSLLNSKIPRLVIILWSILTIPFYIVKLSLVLMLSLVLFKQNFSFKQNIKDTKVLFLSHGTSRNLLNRNKDSFFDLMPQRFQRQKNLKCTILYTNQHLFRFRKDNRLLDLKSEEIKHILMPKFLSFPEHVKYFFSAGNFAFRALLLSFKYYFEEPVLSRILICSIPWYFRRTTYSNYLLVYKIKEVQIKNDLAAIFLTFEGHNYEQLIVDALNENSRKTDIFFYQHSPIISAHHGIRCFLSQIEFKIIILTTGVFYKDYFESVSKIPSYTVVGSNKGNLVLSNSKSEKINKIIYVPEATNFATKDFIYLLKCIIKDTPDYLHILRLHPDVILNIRLRFELIRLKKYNNFFISSNDLGSDLNSSRYLVYRSSAVGIESLQHDLLRIFYAEAKFNGLNVLSANVDTYCEAQNPSDVHFILKSSQNHLSKDRSIDLFNSYFSKINYENFGKAI